MRTTLIVALAVVLAVVGWWALFQLTGRIGPDQAAALVLFFALLLLTLTATLVPITAYLNRRFAPQASARAPLRYLRHSILGGLCLTSWVWLQMHRAFNLGFAFIIALIFVTIEILISRIQGKL